MTSAAAPPIVEKFVLRGLNGYKTIELDTKAAVSIISAENGTGKTTILNALYGVLSGKYQYLLSLNFDTLSLKFFGKDEIGATHKELMDSRSGAVASLPNKLQRYFTHFGISEDEILEMIDAMRLDPTTGFEHPLIKNFWYGSPYSREDITAKLREAAGIVPTATPDDGTFRTSVASAMSGYSVLYLPTYRRIETEIPEFVSEEHPSVRLTRFQNSDPGAGRLINFGLRDVETRLKDITGDIRKGTLEAYARISGRTLDQLVSSREAPADDGSYNIDAIKVVLGRIGKSGSVTETRIIDLIRTGSISNQENDYLRYFLSQMVEVYKEKQLQESAIEKFVKVVAQYWNAPNSEKVFEFDKVSAEATVTNKFTGEILKLNALSSGEKQIFSIFAKIYLEMTKRYIVLIDEPELSLSMEWQRKFLPDILAADSCSQLIAITHSPFVFENDLDPFAGPLKVSFSQMSEKQSCNVMSSDRMGDMRRGRDSETVVLQKYNNFRSTRPGEMIFAFEGGNDVTFYDVMSGNCGYREKYHNFVCDGKDRTLALRRLLSRNLSDDAGRVVFFVDHDFDALKNESPSENIYCTDRYSIENYLTDFHILEKLLCGEFRCFGERASEDISLAMQFYKKSLAQFFICMSDANLIIFYLRKSGLRAKNIDNNLEKYVRISDRGVEAEASIDAVIKLVGADEILSADHLPTVKDEVHNEFSALVPMEHWRGKFNLMMFQKVLEILREDRGRAQPRIFSTRKHMSARFDGDIIRLLASAVVPPNPLRSFFARIPRTDS